MNTKNIACYKRSEPKILSAIEHLEKSREKITLGKIAKVSGCPVQYLYTIDFLSKYIQRRTRNTKHSKTIKAIAKKKNIEDSIETYTDLAKFYFKQPKHIADVVASINNSFEDIDLQMLVSLIHTLAHKETLTRPDETNKFVLVLSDNNKGA